jgi:cell division protein FtsI (penicillin-binding protein 3)
LDFEKTGRFRAVFLCGALLVLFGGLAVRLAHIQLFLGETYASGAKRQQVSRRKIPAMRGRILDRNGHVLAISVPARSLHLDPGAVDDVESAAARHAALLGYPEGELLSLLRRPGRFVPLRRGIEDRGLLRRIAKLDIPWLGVTFEPARHYPAGNLAAHVLGFVGAEEMGRGGLEAMLDKSLRPSSGYRLEERDGSKRGTRIVGTLDDAEPARTGDTVALTLDSRIQTFAEDALDRLVEEWKPEDAVAVVMDPHTGDILASAVRPGFSPDSYQDTPKEFWTNRVVTHPYTPGSSFKPMIAAIALDAGSLRETDTINCDGGVSRAFGGRPARDCHKMGRVLFPEVLVHSSNIGMIKVAMKLGDAALHAGLQRMGFGRRTGVDFPGESGGILHSLKKWREGSALRYIAIGQQMGVTPVQLTRAFCAIATDGRAPRPRYVKDGRPVERERIMSARTAAILRPILGRIVSEGTGRSVRLEHWAAGGKTGTADRMTKNGKDGYHVSFIGMAPISDPRFVVLVLADRPRTDKGVPYGGRVAAPAVKSILQRSLTLYGVPSDAN